MSNWSRRQLFRHTIALSALSPFCRNESAAEEPKSSRSRANAAPGIPKPLVHATDLFRPYNDPDDHWDLATGYGLAWRGDLDLLGVLTDNPENRKNIEELHERQREAGRAVYGGFVKRSPDVAAVAQLNYITDRAVPVTSGTIWPDKPGEKVREDNLPKELRGVNMLLDTLKRSSQPVAILTAGSPQDVAIAATKEPSLFSQKCAGIYLSAGVGSNNPKEQLTDGHLESNVLVNPGAYATMFELPCPIYWMPCFNSGRDVTVGEFGSYWFFQQKDVLPYLSDRLQSFFAYALSKESGTTWLSYLLDVTGKKHTAEYLADWRSMFSTAGFLHAVGQTVTVDGQIVSLDGSKGKAVYEFVPIEVGCNADGITDWRRVETTTSRWIFHVKDAAKYPEAMLRALRSILVNLP